MNKYVRMIPLRERNVAGMIISAILLVLCLLLTVLLWPVALESGEVYWWITAIVLSIASLATSMALITGEMAWMMIGLLLSRQR